MSNKNDQIVYLNNCQILVQSFSLKTKGTYYIVWKKGKKNTQSNKYQIVNDDPITPKDLLSLSLKIYYHGSTPMQRHTHLILFNGAGEEMDRVKLMIHQWTADYQQIQVNLGGGTVKLKVKRKGVMKLQKFHRMRSQLQQTSEDQANKFLKKASNRANWSDKDEILRLSKQVEDMNFLVQKLKQQRNSGLSKIQKLEEQLSKINGRMIKDLQKATEYFTVKLEMRQSIYKQQIQQLVTSFNRNYELNIAMMQNLVHQKFDYQDQIRDLKESNHQYITKQSESFQKLISEMEKHKQTVDQELRDSNQKLHDRQTTISQLNDQIDRLNQQLEQLRTSYKKLQQLKHEEESKLNNHIEQLNIRGVQNQSLINEGNLTIGRLSLQVNQKQEHIVSLTNLINDYQKEKNEMQNEQLKLIDQREQMIRQNQIYKMRLEQSQAQIKDLNNQNQRMRLQYAQDITKYKKDMDEGFVAYTRQIQAERNQNTTLHARNDELYNQKEILTNQLADAKAVNQQRDHQLSILKNALEHEKQLNFQLNKTMTDNLQTFRKHQSQAAQRQGDHITKNSQLQIQNNRLGNQLRQLTYRTREEMAKMKQQYQILTESNKRLFQDQIEMLRKAKQDDQAVFNNMKVDYQHQIAAMIQTNKNQLQQTQRVYRQDSHNKDKQIFQLIQQKSLLQQQFQAFKFKMQMDQMQKQHDAVLNQGKKLRRNAHQVQPDHHDQIQQIQQQQQGEEQELIIPKKKQKPKKKKTIKYSSDQKQQQSFVNIVQDQEQLGQQDNQIFDLIKKKKQAQKQKGKLKVQRTKGRQIGESLQLSQQQQQLQQSPQKKKPKVKQIQQVQEIQFNQQKKPNKNDKPAPGNLNKKQSINVQQIMHQKQALQQRIAELEQQNQNLKIGSKKWKDKYEKQQKKYVNRVKQLQQQIKELQNQIDDLLSKLSQSGNKQIQNIKKQSDRKKKEIENTKQRQKKQMEQYEKNQAIQQQNAKLAKVKINLKQPLSPISEKTEQKIETNRQMIQLQKQQKRRDQYSDRKSREKQDYEKQQLISKIQHFQRLLNDKQNLIDQQQTQIYDSNKQIQKLKGQLTQKGNLYQSKVLQKQKLIVPGPSLYGGQHILKQSISHLQQKVSSEKQKYNQIRLKYQYKQKQNEDLINQVRKCKKNIEQLQQKHKKSSIPRSVQQIQNQVQECNRKILQLSRTLNQSRLQRDSFEDEVRVVRKKMAQISKSSQQNESRAFQSERQSEQLKRKQQRYKRQLQQGQQECKRLKQVNKKTIQQLSQIRKSHTQYIMERKKVMDQIVRLEGIIAQKQTDIIRLNKQMQKQKLKANDYTQGKQGKQRQYKAQMDKLQIQRSKLERKNRQHQQNIKILKQKLDNLQRQGKKTIQERKQNYGDKLKKYIQQIKNVKQIVQQYQDQNSRLKIQNSQFFEQNQILKMSYQKLQLKFQELSQHNYQNNDLLTKYKEKVAQLEGIIKKKQAQESKLEITLSALRKQLDNERLVSRKKTQKLQSFQQQNQRYIYDIKNLKIKLNEYETNADQKHKLSQEVYKSQNTIDSLQQQLHKISQQYHFHSEKFVFTRQDVQTALRQLKQHQDKIKEDQFSRIVTELDQNNSANRQKMQNQLLTLYNQNQKLRVNMHKANQDLLQIQYQLSELQNLREKSKRLEKEKTILDRKVIQLNDEIKALKEDSRRIQIKYNESIKNQQGKSTQNVVLLQRLDQITKKYQQLGQNYNQLKIQDKRLLEKYKLVNNQKQQSIQLLTTQLQNLHNKLLASQLQINRLKQIQGMTNQDSFKKIRKLESKIQQITESYKHKQKQTQVHYKNIIRQLKTKITKFEEDMMDKLRRIQQLNEGVLMLQTQVQQLTEELTNTRAQLSEQGQLYTLQINKVRNQMREMQELYDKNMRNLEEELSAMSKQLTSLKFARQNMNSSRLKKSRHSELGEDNPNKRYEEKIKLKDRRIEELKETILAYQQKIIQISKTSNKNEQIDGLKIRFSQKQHELISTLQRRSQQLKDITNDIKGLKDQNHKLKIKHEELICKIQQKDLEISSLKSELMTVSKLYGDLQKQIDKRKQNLNRQIEYESVNKLQLQRYRKQISVKQQIILQLTEKSKQNELLIRKKQLQNKNNKQRIYELEKEKNESLDQYRKINEGEGLGKLKIKQTEKQIDILRIENRKLRNQNNLIMKQNQSLKNQVNQKHITLNNLIKQIQNNDIIIGNNQHHLSKYISLNQQSLNKLGVPLDQLVLTALQFRETIKFKDQQMLKLTQQIQEMKFLLESKFIDYDAIKRQNYELIAREQQRQNNSLQIQQMQQNILNLERKIQQLQFKEQAIKMQLGNINSNLQQGRQINGRQLRKKIQNVLIDNFI